MYQLKINTLTPSEFLEQYWQKKPLLIKGGFSDFVDPIEPEELAGLAMEENIESRIITNHNQQWHSHQGPFEDFNRLTEQNSTLLVQAVDHWHPESAQLLEPFRFIPNWRIDDLMVSYSTPGGGVGPHLDQYDVFIVQGEGKRHWRVGLACDDITQFAQNKSLLHVKQFQAVIDEVLQPGDILYIPPGAPHEGYAIENALNYSIGFRAPDQKELISSFADHLIDKELGKKRYTDPSLSLRNDCGEILPNEVSQIKNLMKETLDNNTVFSQWICEQLSTPKHEMDLAPLEPTLSEQQLMTLLEQNDVFYKAGGVKSVFIIEKNEIIFSVNGENYFIEKEALEQIKLLSNYSEIHTKELKLALKYLNFAKMLINIVSIGAYFVHRVEES